MYYLNKLIYAVIDNMDLIHLLIYFIMSAYDVRNYKIFYLNYSRDNYSTGKCILVVVYVYNLHDRY